MENIKQIFGNTPTIVKMPFKGECIESIHIHANRSWSNPNKFIITGSVKFKNGNTTGTQEFEARNLSELFMEIQKFCSTLGF